MIRSSLEKIRGACLPYRTDEKPDGLCLLLQEQGWLLAKAWQTGARDKPMYCKATVFHLSNVSFSRGTTQ